jgi:hypothetical protein
MAFILDTRNTEYLHNYAVALAHHDSITPIRNSNCRPVAERRKTHFNIRKHGDSIIVRLYATDLVTYTPDNKITLNMGGMTTNTMSTRAAVHAVTRTQITQQHSRTWVRDHDGKCFLFQNGMQLQAGEYYCYHKIIDPVYPETHTLKRKELNAKLRQFKGYYNYMLGLSKVDAWRGQGSTQRHALDALTNPDNYKNGVFDPEPEYAFELSKAIMGDYSLTTRNTYWRFFVDHHWDPNYSPIAGLDLEKIISTSLKRAIIKTHKEELLTKSTVTDGKIIKDPYVWV